MRKWFGEYWAYYVVSVAIMVFAVCCWVALGRSIGLAIRSRNSPSQCSCPCRCSSVAEPTPRKR